MKALLWLVVSGLAWGGIVNYSYDAAGRLVKVDYGGGGSIVYTYDNAGNLKSRTTVSAATTANPAAAPAAPEKKAPPSESKPKTGGSGQRAPLR